MIDITPSRLEFAKTYCTQSQVLLERPQLGEPNMDYARRTAAKILETEPLADVVIDCTGAETCVQMSVLVSSVYVVIYRSLTSPSSIVDQEWWLGGLGGYGCPGTKSSYF
jgi:threonine dehydrogenase-like Zn-dependent dehydrogenase